MRYLCALTLALLALPIESWAQATPSKNPPALPTVVEMFTSKYCPNCPAAEKKMEKLAAENPSLLILFEHVDYWDEGPRKDPYGLADITQRQYDYGNALGHRPGEVFTPMPLLNGQVIANPPLWLNWEGALRNAKAKPVLARLDVKKEADGSLSVATPESLKPVLGKTVPEVWLLAATPVESTGVWRVRGVAQAVWNGPKARVPAAEVPTVGGKPAPRYIMLLQQPGPGAVLAVGETR